MNINSVASSSNHLRYIGPPGCESTFVDHPNPQCRNLECVEVAFVMEHRFAFCYWLKCKQNLQSGRCGQKPISEADFRPPDLVTWDWHNDCGADSDVVENKLTALNQSDQQEVAEFAWTSLCQLDDGQILPAVWLNALGNVYIIQKQLRNHRRFNRSFRDRFGREHQIHYFRSPAEFVKAFERTNSGTGAIWDVDMDYFTKTRRIADQRYTPALSGEQIQATLSPENSWMPVILRDLKAVTVALEPKYTGGLTTSLELFRHWESALFSAPLFNKKCRWRKGLVTA